MFQMKVSLLAQSLVMMTLLASLELGDCWSPGIEKCDPAVLPRSSEIFPKRQNVSDI